MTSLLFDTNALIYWIHPDSSFHEEALCLVEEAYINRSTICALSSSLNDVYYILCRHYMTEEEARESLRDIVDTFDLIDLTGLFVHESIDSDEPDYEDGLIRVAAEELQVEAIISYDKAAFKNSFVPKMTAQEALVAFFQTEKVPRIDFSGPH